jgi:hypothetical protein
MRTRGTMKGAAFKEVERMRMEEQRALKKLNVRSINGS